MIIDKEEHRAALLELIDAAHFPGKARRLVMELATAIEAAIVDTTPRADKASDAANFDPQVGN